MRTRILHVSDLHVGARHGGDEQALRDALATLVERTAPQLVIATGDLTHRGRRSQQARAAEILRAPGVTLVAVPGNHDARHTFPGRFVRPWSDFEQAWDTTEPIHASPGILVVGLNSVRLWRHQSGLLSDAQLTRATERLSGAEPGAIRIVAFHHQLVNAPWRTRKRPLAHRGHVLETLAAAGADLILGGHVHQAAVAERREFDVGTSKRPVVVSIAPGLGRPRPNRRGEARGALLYDVDEHALEITTYIGGDDGWAPTATRRFPRVS